MGLEVARFSDSNPKYVKGRRAQAGLLPSLDTTLPRNDGVYQYIDIRLREGAVVGIPTWYSMCGSRSYPARLRPWGLRTMSPKWPSSTRGHAGHGFEGATVCTTSETDFRRNHEPYGNLNLFAASGSGATRGFDGWPNFFAASVGGSVIASSVELTEMVSPQLIWEAGIRTYSAGAVGCRMGA